MASEGKKPRKLYLDVANQVNIPFAQRSACVKGRSGSYKIPRRYHLQSSEIVQLKKEMQESGRFISPYGKERIYTYIIEALVILGPGKPHLFSFVYDKFVELSSAEKTRNAKGCTLWERFEKRQIRNFYTGKDVRGKFMQNLEVLQRLGGNHPYGLKLAQVGACIDIIMDDKQQVMVELKIDIPEGDPVRPINLNRKRSYTKTLSSVLSGLIIEQEETNKEEDPEEI